MKNCFFLLTVLFILLSGCNKTVPKRTEDSKFVRVWFDTVQMMPFASKLDIKENNTFEYKAHGCQSGSKSNGTWRIESDTIILKSIKPKGCLFQHHFGIYCISIDDKSYWENNKTIKGCEPNGRVDSYEAFESEKFFIRNDTLIHANKRKDACPELRIAFSTKEKVRKRLDK